VVTGGVLCSYQLQQVNATYESSGLNLTLMLGTPHAPLGDVHTAVNVAVSAASTLGQPAAGLALTSLALSCGAGGLLTMPALPSLLAALPPSVVALSVAGCAVMPPVASGLAAWAPQLTTLRLTGVQLTGTLPDTLPALAMLQHLTIDSAPGITGALPASWGMANVAPAMSSLMLTDLSISGTLPVEWQPLLAEAMVVNLRCATLRAAAADLRRRRMASRVLQHFPATVWS
jgi:hypothetical protein